ncbi:hypothetical protein LEN26_020690 [Aphanomyces euteiches]|nr:hypothetical protein LEN26_020690 [Aphanomyces euteiches]
MPMYIPRRNFLINRLGWNPRCSRIRYQGDREFNGSVNVYFIKLAKPHHITKSTTDKRDARPKLTLDVHLSDDIDDEGTSISALETRLKHTVSGDFESIARKHWNGFFRSNGPISREVRMAIAVLNDANVWRNSLIVPTLLTVAGFFKQQDRIVITHCFLARDELFSPGDGVLLSHGFSWTVFEATRPDITLVHNLCIYGTPMTQDGRMISLETIGSFFGLSAFGIQHRDAYIELVRASAEKSFTQGHNVVFYL